MLIKGKSFANKRYTFHRGAIEDHVADAIVEVITPPHTKEHLYKVNEALSYTSKLNDDYWLYMLECFKYLDNSANARERNYNQKVVAEPNGEVETYDAFLTRLKGITQRNRSFFF